MKNALLATLVLAALFLTIYGISALQVSLDAAVFYLLGGIVLFAAAEIIRRVWK